MKELVIWGVGDLLIGQSSAVRLGSDWRPPTHILVIDKSPDQQITKSQIIL